MKSLVKKSFWWTDSHYTFHPEANRAIQIKRNLSQSTRSVFQAYAIIALGASICWIRKIDRQSTLTLNAFFAIGIGESTLWLHMITNLSSFRWSKSVGAKRRNQWKAMDGNGRSWRAREPDKRFGLNNQVWSGGVLNLLETSHSGWDWFITLCI